MNFWYKWLLFMLFIGSSNSLSSYEIALGQRFYWIDVIYLSILIVSGVLFNLFVPIAIYIDRSLLTSSNILILNIIFADLIVCGYVIPVILANRILDTNVMGTIGCQFNSFLTFLSMGISNSIFMIISLDRYLFIFYRCTHTRWFTIKRITIFLIIIWALWFAYGTSLTFMRGFEYEIEGYICFFSDEIVSMAFTIMLIIFNFILPICVSLCFYIILLIKLRRVKNVIFKEKGDNIKVSDSQNNRQEMKTIILLIITMATFVICWGPYAFHIFVLNNNIDINNMFHKIIHWAPISNSTFNGWLFGIMNSRYRKAIKKRFFHKNRIHESKIKTIN